MTLVVRWSSEAELTFDVIVDLIDERWGAVPAEKFRQTTKRTLRAISQQALSFPESGIDNVRKAVITKQTSVYYEVYEQQVILLFFWDNRQDPLFFYQ